MSSIDQQSRDPREHAGSITALTRHLPVTESVMLPPDVRDYIMGVFYRPPSPKRKNITMRPRITRGRTTPGPSGFDILAFTGDHNLQRSVELVDPMKSLETAGWLRGELRAPV
jgi:hypothetical protein